MNEKLFLDKRAQAIPISQKEYLIFLLKGLYFYLINDLEKFLDKEGRYYGSMVSNIRKIRVSIKSIENPEDDLISQEEMINRIVYLYKPIIIQEYKKFLKKRVSKADSIICICKRIIDTVGPILYSEDFTEEEEHAVDTIKTIIESFYNNIKNRNKEYSCSTLTDLLSTCIDESLVGSYESERFSILREEEQRKKKSLLNGSGIRIDSSDFKLTEISWTDE